MPGQSRTTIHSPYVPDDQYYAWTYDRQWEQAWAEVYVSYGNDRVVGTVGLQAYDFTDTTLLGNKADPTQFGIGQAWVTVTPDLPAAARASEGRRDLRSLRRKRASRVDDPRPVTPERTTGAPERTLDPRPRKRPARSPAGGSSGGVALPPGKSGSLCGGRGAERAKRVEAERPHSVTLVTN